MGLVSICMDQGPVWGLFRSAWIKGRYGVCFDLHGSRACMGFVSICMDQGPVWGLFQSARIKGLYGVCFDQEFEMLITRVAFKNEKTFSPKNTDPKT